MRSLILIIVFVQDSLHQLLRYWPIDIGKVKRSTTMAQSPSMASLISWVTTSRSVPGWTMQPGTPVMPSFWTKVSIYEFLGGSLSSFWKGHWGGSSHPHWRARRIWTAPAWLSPPWVSRSTLRSGQCLYPFYGTPSGLGAELAGW